MPSKKSRPNTEFLQNFRSDEIIEELSTLKKLVMVLLAKLGSDSSEIGKAIGVPPRTLRDWVSFNGIESILENAEQKEKKGVKRKTKKANKVVMEEKTDPVSDKAESEK